MDSLQFGRQKKKTLARRPQRATSCLGGAKHGRVSRHLQEFFCSVPFPEGAHRGQKASMMIQ